MPAWTLSSALHFQVEANLSVQFAIQTLREEQRPQA
jgi:hypothetical protein